MPITLNGTTGEIPATWTTATRPASPTAGQIGYNTTTAALDVYNGSAWTTALPATSGLATLSNLALNGSTSGTTTLSPSATASGTITLPAGTGTVAVNGVSSNLVLGTAVASTSGTSIDFTSLPSWVKRITVMFNGVSTSGTSPPQMQIGAGSVTTSGYVCTNAIINAAPGTAAFTSGFGIGVNTGTWAAAIVISGAFRIANITGNTWVCEGMVARTDGTTAQFTTSGSISLSGALDRVRITTANGTDTFDAGSINIMYE